MSNSNEAEADSGDAQISFCRRHALKTGAVIATAVAGCLESEYPGGTGSDESEEEDKDKNPLEEVHNKQVENETDQENTGSDEEDKQEEEEDENKLYIEDLKVKQDYKSRGHITALLEPGQDADTDQENIKLTLSQNGEEHVINLSKNDEEEYDGETVVLQEGNYSIDLSQIQETFPEADLEYTQDEISIDLFDFEDIYEKTYDQDQEVFGSDDNREPTEEDFTEFIDSNGNIQDWQGLIEEINIWASGLNSDGYATEAAHEEYKAIAHNILGLETDRFRVLRDRLGKSDVNNFKILYREDTESDWKKALGTALEVYGPGPGYHKGDQGTLVRDEENEKLTSSTEINLRGLFEPDDIKSPTMVSVDKAREWEEYVAEKNGMPTEQEKKETAKEYSLNNDHLLMVPDNNRSELTLTYRGAKAIESIQNWLENDEFNTEVEFRENLDVFYANTPYENLLIDYKQQTGDDEHVLTEVQNDDEFGTGYITVEPVDREQFEQQELDLIFNTPYFNQD